MKSEISNETLARWIAGADSGEFYREVLSDLRHYPQARERALKNYMKSREKTELDYKDLRDWRERLHAARYGGVYPY